MKASDSVDNGDKNNGNNPRKWGDLLTKLLIGFGFAYFLFRAVMHRYGG